MISDNQRDIGSIIIVDEASQSAIVEFNGIKFKTALHNLVKAKKVNKKISKIIWWNIKIRRQNYY